MRFILLFLLGLPFLGLWVEPVPALSVCGERQSLIIELNSTSVVECSFLHSVEKVRVVELFRPSRDGLLLYEVRTKSFGWGLPSSEAGYSIKRVDGEDWFVFQMSRSLTGLMIATDPVNDYQIRVENRVIKLDDFGRMVKIEVKSPHRLVFGIPGWKTYLRAL